MDQNLHHSIVVVGLVRVYVRVHDVIVKAVNIINSLELLSFAADSLVVVVVDGVRSALELLFGADVRLLLAALQVARLHAQHERDANHHDHHEQVHESDLVIVAARVAKKWRLVRVGRLSAAHSHVEHRVDDCRGF